MNHRMKGSARFGPGAYFAEASSKCDEYASEDPSGLFAGKCALLLCRVVCGAPGLVNYQDGLSGRPPRALNRSLHIRVPIG